MLPAVEALFVITMYSIGCDVKESNPTKSGVLPVVGFTVAADPKVLPIGSIVVIEGFGERMVQDIGGKVKGRHIDIFVESCSEAREWGRRVKNVRVVRRPTQVAEGR